MQVGSTSSQYVDCERNSTCECTPTEYADAQETYPPKRTMHIGVLGDVYRLVCFLLNAPYNASLAGPGESMRLRR